LSGGILEITLLKAGEMAKKIPLLAKAARATLSPAIVAI
jgi:hypothetical protein